MNFIKAINSIKKKIPNIYLMDITNVDILDFYSENGKVDQQSLIVSDLYMLDIQTLICKILFKQMYSVWPRWCRIINPENVNIVHLIILDNLSCNTWMESLVKYSHSKIFKNSYEELMLKLNKSVKFINPAIYGIPWRVEFFEIPYLLLNKKPLLSENIEKPLDKKNKKKKIKQNELALLIRLKYNINFDNNSSEQKNWFDTFPRTELLMNSDEKLQERIPLFNDNNFRKNSLSSYVDVTPFSPLFAIDCEMVECYDSETNNFCKSLASVSIVNEKRETIYHTFVKPAKYIVNYLTKYSGITPKIIQKATHTLEDVQKDISKLLPPDAILVGHSVSNDLEVLQLFHPYLIDTSLVYNLKHNRFLKPNLKLLSKIFLNRDIQLGGKLGHSSLEDAMATMDLILLKLSKSFGFGNTAYDTDLGIQCDETILQTAEEADQEQQILIPELEKTEVSYSAEITSDTEHLNHKRKLKQIYDCGDCKNLLKYIDQYHITQVALVNDDMTGFSEPWVKNHLEKGEICKSNSSNLKIPPLYISEISFASLNEGELPKKKWFCRLLKKISKEFDVLPPNSMCGLILVDGIFNAKKEDSEYGKIYLGINSSLSE